MMNRQARFRRPASRGSTGSGLPRLSREKTARLSAPRRRTWASLVFGAACGVLGVEGWIGLAGYPLSQAALFLLLYVRTQGKLAEFFESTREAALRCGNDIGVHIANCTCS